MKLWKVVLAIYVLAASAPSTPVLRSQAVSAQASATVDPSLYSGMRWRSVGPARGDDRSRWAAVKHVRSNIGLATTGGGAWKTTDGGSNWAPMTDGKIDTSSIGSLAVCQSNPDVVYIGGGETQLRGNIIQGDGVYKTTDGGVKWDHLSDLRDSQAIARLRVHPTNCDIVYAAVLGQIYNEHPQRGIFKSSDGGKTWRRTLFRDDKTGGVDLSIDPKNPNVIFASLWEANRTPWSMSSGGPGSGLFKSTDGGDTWTEITKNPACPRGCGARSACRCRAPTAIAFTPSSRTKPPAGLYLSDDAGATWKLMNDNRNMRQRAFYYTRLNADPKDKDTVYVLNVQFFKSTDGGKTTTTIRVPHGDNHDLWISSTDNKRMVQSNDGSANVTWNGGRRGPIRTFRPASSTTSSRPSTCRITSAARSRTTARRASAARPTPAPARAACRRSSMRWAAARAATSRPTPKTSTSSSPAATAAT